MEKVFLKWARVYSVNNVNAGVDYYYYCYCKERWQRILHDFCCVWCRIGFSLCLQTEPNAKKTLKIVRIKKYFRLTFSWSLNLNPNTEHIFTFYAIPEMNIKCLKFYKNDIFTSEQLLLFIEYSACNTFVAYSQRSPFFRQINVCSCVKCVVYIVVVGRRFFNSMEKLKIFGWLECHNHYNELIYCERFHFIVSMRLTRSLCFVNWPNLFCNGRWASV